MLNKLVFLSSLGIDRIPEDPRESVVNRMNQEPLLQRIVFKIYRTLPFKITPFGPLRVIGRVFAPMFIKKFMRRRMNGIPQDQFNAFYHYLYQVSIYFVHLS
jgi:hypothetical protein